MLRKTGLGEKEDWRLSLIIRGLRMLLLILENSEMIESNAILQHFDFVFWIVVLIFVIFIPIIIKLAQLIS